MVQRSHFQRVSQARILNRFFNIGPIFKQKCETRSIRHHVIARHAVISVTVTGTSALSRPISLINNYIPMLKVQNTSRIIENKSIGRNEKVRH